MKLSLKLRVISLIFAYLIKRLDVNLFLGKPNFVIRSIPASKAFVSADVTIIKEKNTNLIWT